MRAVRDCGGGPYGHVVTVHRMPAAEVDLSVEVVRQLLAGQHPDLAGLAVEVLANGWDNMVCTVGADLLARLPRRALAAELVAHEQRWLPALAPGLPLPIPAPVRIGRPAGSYPWNWSVVPFFPGQAAALTAPDDLAAAAVALGEFLAALHATAPPDAPVNPFRGGPLAERTGRVTEHLRAIESGTDAGAARAIWESAMEAGPWAGPPAWIHGDLHPANILVDAGRISAVIDFGDLTSGDPATDLSVAWMLFTARERAIFWQAYGQADDHTWARARGWALSLALVFLTYSADNPLMARIGKDTFREVLS
jgi:aminoglycoside phosphotransferase (APT) family kinase protein